MMLSVGFSVTAEEGNPVRSGVEVVDPVITTMRHMIVAVVAAVTGGDLAHDRHHHHGETEMRGMTEATAIVLVMFLLVMLDAPEIDPLTIMKEGVYHQNVQDIQEKENVHFPLNNLSAFESESHYSFFE
mmetsp:Transcript_11847/g.14781  ORF Transcript_11847/g.14781 Transcript_11847/m.14781 type:complete len:129 (+) Transcript_11847:680-1066(+)